jgi:hypothetical protein
MRLSSRSRTSSLLLAMFLACSSNAACEGGSAKVADDADAGDMGDRDGAAADGEATSRDGGDGDSMLGPDGSTPEVPQDLSERMACIANVKAQCSRHARCRYVTIASCNAPEQLCPDSAFSPGSTREAASLYACARQWDNFDCTDLAAGKIPSCLTPGTREIGEACIFASQCKTLACSGSPTTCGQCVERIAIGGACSVGGAPCVMGAACEQGTCAVPTPVEPNGSQLLGSPCQPSLGGCVAGASCQPDMTSEGKFRCRLLALGELCGPDDCPTDTAYCDDVCVSLPKIGQPCAPSRAGARRCELGAYCDFNECAARAPLGERCTSNQCLEGLECEERTPQGYGKCLAFHEEGQSCSGQFERCVRNTECIDGICRAISSRMLFESACGGS